jgi:DNA-binding beta-propeller fold protein YncE
VCGISGTAGTTATFLSSPYSVAFDPYQYMYVVDTNNHRIQQFLYGIDQIFDLNK